MVESINAQCFCLTDESGIVRAEISLANGRQPSIRLYDRHRRERLVIELNESDQPVVALLDKNGAGIIGIGHTAEDAIGVQISDQEGKPGILLTIHPDGTRQI